MDRETIPYKTFQVAIYQFIHSFIVPRCSKKVQVRFLNISRLLLFFQEVSSTLLKVCLYYSKIKKLQKQSQQQSHQQSQTKYEQSQCNAKQFERFKS